jgi:hypothetical protein
MLVFVLLQAVYLGRFMQTEADAPASSDTQP